MGEDVTKLEQVAKAIGDVFTAEHDAVTAAVLTPGISQVKISAMMDAMLDKCARAAIEAMREPTLRMVMSAQHVFLNPTTGTSRGADPAYQSDWDPDHRRRSRP